ncbi:MAG: tRNA dimethylallyltransferase, partial [Candidatus Peribacteraceae bacterium]|nr:tRNA dimethylallyltransferase [Candidatus Peribacteraceae bacterium]
PALRAQLSAAYDGDHGAALFAQLQERDPEAALGIDPRNKVYLLRALEISLLAQQALSAAKKKSSSPYDLFIIGVQCPRAALHRRINERVRQMFDAGWVEEVRGLLKRGYTMNDPGLKSHGYREIASALANGQLSSDRELQLIADISAKTRQYAKRQMTWWKHDPRIHWIVP